MLDFSLNKTYDVVMCLFSAIGYVGGRENVTDALATFKRHLRPDGLIMLEPWFAPEHWKAGRVQLQTVDKDELKICRMSYSGLNGRQSKIRFEYLIGTPDGIAHEMEEHELWLSTVEELLGSFADAGLHADFEPEGLFGRGLYTARPFPIAKS